MSKERSGRRKRAKSHCFWFVFDALRLWSQRWCNLEAGGRGRPTNHLISTLPWLLMWDSYSNKAKKCLCFFDLHPSKTRLCKNICLAKPKCTSKKKKKKCGTQKKKQPKDDWIKLGIIKLKEELILCISACKYLYLDQSQHEFPSCKNLFSLPSPPPIFHFHLPTHTIILLPPLLPEPLTSPAIVPKWSHGNSEQRAAS